jgi:two-component system chemotaxis response regulator CheY
MLASLSSILAKAGVAVERACSGEEALGKLKQSPPLRLIITDFHMPGMNGVELIQRVRSIAAYRFLPILVLTTESDQAKRGLARTAGATGWLVKPVTPDNLLAVLQQVAPV